MTKSFFPLWLVTMLSLLAIKSNSQEVKFTFLDEEVELLYNNFLFDDSNCLSSIECLKKFHVDFIVSNSDFITHTLKWYSKFPEDYVFAAFLKKVCQEVVSFENKRIKDMMLWVLLSENGYNIPIVYSEEDFYLIGIWDYVLVSGSYIDYKGKKFIGINSPLNLDIKKYNVLELFPDQDYIYFDNYFKKTKKLSPKKKLTKKRFYMTDRDSIDLFFDELLIQKLSYLPNFGLDTKIIKKKFSKHLCTSLIKPIRKTRKKRGYGEAIKLVIDFCRVNVKYQLDSVSTIYEDRTFFPEETLYYQYGDCEDIVVLASFLLKELFDIHSIIVIYEDHVNLGVLNVFDKAEKNNLFQYKNKEYLLIDLTAPDPLSAINRPSSSIIDIIETP